MKTVNTRGLACPEPVIITKKALSESKGDIKVLIDNDIAKENVIKLLKNSNYQYEQIETESGFEIVVKNIKAKSDDINDKGFIVLCKSDLFGQGEAKLGSTLMKSFFYSLTELSSQPEKIIFMNSGVKLALSTSPILESLSILENSGCEILSCGTCLDFYNVTDELSIGSVTNMYTSVELLASSNKVISI